jgi:hypothetical protein
MDKQMSPYATPAIELSGRRMQQNASGAYWQLIRYIWGGWDWFLAPIFAGAMCQALGGQRMVPIGGNWYACYRQVIR